MLKFQVQRGDQNKIQSQIQKYIRKVFEKRKFRNPGCHRPTPLRKISSSRLGCSGNHRKLTVLRKLVASRVSFLPPIVLRVASNIYAEGVYFTRFVDLS